MVPVLNCADCKRIAAPEHCRNDIDRMLRVRPGASEIWYRAVHWWHLACPEWYCLQPGCMYMYYLVQE